MSQIAVKGTMRRVSYIYSPALNSELDKIEQINGRSALVHSLVFAYGLQTLLVLLNGSCASDDELLAFHSSDYIENLKSIDNIKDLEKCEEYQETYGLGYDCPLFNGIYHFVRAVVGSSVSAARSLIQLHCTAAINWYGGWHHADRDEARGFCYANDIVCAIHVLQQKYRRILYIDLDLHHGDGVENAFAFSRSVLTFSIHKYELGFYPGSGAITDLGKGNGRFYSVNVPLKDGIRDEPYCKIFDRLTSVILEAFQPDAVVVQCGCDSLIGDPLGTFNVTLKGLGHCINQVLSWEKPSLFLGGGGYNKENTARCWTYLTSLIVGKEISKDIPDHNNFLKYGPCFDLDIQQGNRPDCNTGEEIEKCISIITDNVRNIQTPC